MAYEVHDADHLPNRILRRALARVRRTTSSADLLHRADAALVDFPEISDTPIRPSDWARVRSDRSARTKRYRKAIELARMILLDERPDLRWGDREVVALLFDMNALFEAYLEQVLRGLPGVRVRAQVKRRFWQPAGESPRVIKPDLVVHAEGEPSPMVVDAKWKVPDRGRPPTTTCGKCSRTWTASAPSAACSCTRARAPSSARARRRSSVAAAGSSRVRGDVPGRAARRAGGSGDGAGGVGVVTSAAAPRT